MKTIVLVATVVLIFRATTFPQTVYKLPFASKDNRVELTVSNTSALTAKAINVTVSSCPSWIRMRDVEEASGEIAPNKEKTYSFNFDVDKSAPVGKEETINFTIASSNKETWAKEIKVKASAPDKYELYQNYPNPFNPSTIISYQLPEDSKVTIKIYDILGREVATLLNNEEKKAGYYENNFSAGGGSSAKANALSSGVYIYRLSAKSSDGKSKEFNSTKKMMIIK